MLAKDLIDRLERLSLLDQEIIEALREQLQQSGNRVTPEAIAKLLVDNGQLTRFQATKLIGELRSDQYDESEEDGEAAGTVAEDDELTFLDEEPVAEEAEAIAEAVPIAVAKPASEPLADPASDAAGVQLSDMGSDHDLGGAPRRPRTETTSVWDSFKVYGRAGIVALLLLIGGVLFFVLSKGNADEAIQQANQLYDEQNYQAAQERYDDFLDDYSEDNPHASRARTRVVLSRLYRARDVPDATEGLTVAKAELPKIAEEEALGEDRADLSALLTDIAENIVEAARKSKSTDTKRELLGKLEEHRQLMENPLYVPAKMRVTLQGRLAAVEESRARVQREINRNIQLGEAVASMTASLDERNTKATYDTRHALLRDFPELRGNEQLDKLIRQASQIQQALVESSSRLPAMTQQPVPSDAIGGVMLTNRDGESIAGLEDEIVYMPAGGSVLAFNAANGELLWRKFVGKSQSHPPIRLDGGVGVLLSNGDLKEVARYEGPSGELVWRSQLDESFSRPWVERDEVYVSCDSGRVVSLDMATGEARWATQIPQPIDVAPGVDDRASRGYLPGDHSNLYVLNTRNGKCVESFYLGHRQGSVAVPPVPLLGHLFVIENTTSDSCRVHVLKFEKNGQGLTVAQTPFLLDGNVRVRPIVQQRRLVVLTDLGQVSVLDVELSTDRDQVSEIATCSPSYQQPTATQMTADRSQMWIAGTRLARYELQVNKGQVARDWVEHESDTFIGQPVVIDDTLIHGRVLRGTTGVRVTAASPETGETLWSTDVGVPVAAVAKVDGRTAFHAITSQAALFELDVASMKAGSTRGPIENPGGNGVAMRFDDPIDLDDGGGQILINQRKTSEILVYEPSRTREKLRRVSIQLPRGAGLSARPIISGGGLLMPLDTGRIVLMRPQTGAMLGSPFQPPSDPTQKVKWSDPVSLADDPDQVVIADSRNKLYRLRVGQQIRELSQTDLEATLKGPTARVGSTLVATVAGPAADYLVGYDLTSLEPTFKTELGGHVQWGPLALGDDATDVLIQTDDRVVRAFDGSGKRKGQWELPPGRLVGKPVADDGQWILAGRDGWVRAIDPKSSEVVGQADLGQPISATPLAIGNGNLLVPGDEGLIYLVKLTAGSP